MKKNSILYLCLMMYGILVSCNNQEATGGFVIKGKIKNFDEKSIALNEITTKGLVFLDTATVEPDGSFEFSGKVSEKTFCTITTASGAVVLVVDSASEIVLSIDAKNTDTYGVNGSPESEQLRQVMQANNKYMIMMRNMEDKYARMSNGVPDAQTQQMIRTEYDSIMRNRSNELKQMAFQLNSIVPYFITNFLITEADFDFFAKVDQQLFIPQSQSKYAQELHSRVELLRKTAIGQTAPEIIQNDPFGKKVALSSLRGKYVLIDFWASWCRPCREENPNVVRLYNKYKTRGFDIFSVSLDDNRDAWTKAINDDKLLWTHVSDLTKWNSGVVKDYNIEAIPFTVLIDKDGKIIAKNLRGKDLENKLEALLGGF